MAAVISGQTVITTTEMHSAGEPVRIVDLTRDNPSSRDVGYPVVIPGRTLLEKRRYVRDYLDAYRKFLMWEPRGHRDMYGALIVTPDTCRSVNDDDADEGEEDATVADMAVLFMHNEGYSTMCGHAVIALGRYAVDYGLLVDSDRLREPETEVRIQCPCGVVKAYVERSEGKTTGRVRFHSVPAFAFALGKWENYIDV
jgi:proline racemase